VKKTKLRPDELTIDARLQQRAKGLDPTTLAEYADAWKAGADFPPVVVFDVDGTLYVTQGFHRYESARMAGIVRLAVERYHYGLGRLHVLAVQDAALSLSRTRVLHVGPGHCGPGRRD
jgi:hypothetical protein